MEGDVFTYVYTVSSGKIIGTGYRVRWDLTGVKPGIYTITAAVMDDSGHCEKSKMKTISVREPLSCP